MKIAYFDCFSGISGDMAVGALLDAGVPLRVVEEGLARLGLGAATVHLAADSTMRNQIHATRFRVISPEAEPLDVVAVSVEGHAREDRAYGHSYRDEPYHGPEHAYGDIVGLIERSTLADRVKQRVHAIFKEIAIAEGRIRNLNVDEVVFDGVGALDSVATVVAVALCLDHLGIDEVYSAVVPLGSGGMIQTQYGAMPLPAPATLEILKGYPVTLASIPFELTTPVGGGIIKALSRGTLANDRIQVERIGFGAGTIELPDRPNLLRVVVGELIGAEEHDLVTVIESNIDDMNPQVYPYLIERLLESGAYEAYLSPVIMKKGRPGMVLTVLAPSGAVDELTKVIYRETTTIGLRYREMNRRKLPREEILVPTGFGAVRMKKIETLDGFRIVPEYEEARRIARERALPLHEVLVRLDEVARNPEHLAHLRSGGE